MRMKKRHIIPMLLILVVPLWQCEQSGLTRPQQFWSKEDNQDVTVDLEYLPVLSLQNYYGGMLIFGHSKKDEIKIAITKKAQSTDRDQLDRMLSSIQVPVTQHRDTLFLQVTAPVAKRNEHYACGLNLFIPYSMPVHVSYAKSSIITSELDSLVHVQRAQLRVRVERHRGSADIQAESDINLEFYDLWPHNYVSAVTDSGDVNVVFPSNADVTIFAQSFYHPIELINFDLPTYLRSFYTADGVLGSGATPINLKTTYGIIRLKAD